MLLRERLTKRRQRQVPQFRIDDESPHGWRIGKHPKVVGALAADIDAVICQDTILDAQGISAGKRVHDDAYAAADKPPITESFCNLLPGDGAQEAVVVCRMAPKSLVNTMVPVR